MCRISTALCLAAACCLTADAAFAQERSGGDVVRDFLEQAARNRRQDPPAGNGQTPPPARTSPVPPSNRGPSFRIGPIRVTPGQGGVRVSPVGPEDNGTNPPRRTFPITTPGYPGTGRPAPITTPGGPGPITTPGGPGPIVVAPGGPRPPELIIDPVPGRGRIVVPVAPPRYEVCPVPEYVPPSVGGTHRPTGVCRIVDPTPGPEPELPALEPGQEITLFGANFGNSAGEVLIGVGPMIMTCEVVRWAPNEAAATLPDFPLANEVLTDVAVKRRDGVVAHEYQVRLVPPREPAVTLPVVYAGQTVTIAGHDLGERPGHVALSAGPLELRTTFVAWTPASAVVTVPRMTFREEIEALMTVVTADGTVADEIAVRFSPEEPPPAPAISASGPAVR